MSAVLDHLVLKLRDEPAMVTFYTDLLGFEAERLEDYRSGRAPFPSIRINATTIIDLLPPGELSETPPDTPNRNLDHFCVALDRAAWDAVHARLTEHGVQISGPHSLWGARGQGTSIYVKDPDGNGVELKTYDS